MKGEIGFFTFTHCYDVKSESAFVVQQAKNYYYTESYKEIMLYSGVVERSYRSCATTYNRLVFQDSAQESRRLQEQVEQESRRYCLEQAATSAAILEKAHFNQQGQPLVGLEKTVFLTQDPELLQQSFDILYDQAPAEIKPHLVLQMDAYEDPKHSTNIGIDDVCTKKQRNKRRTKEEKEEKQGNQKACKGTDKSEKSKNTLPINGDFKQKYAKRQFQYQTVIHLQSTEGQYFLNAQNLGLLFPILIAFLLKNDGLSRNWVIFTDGQKTLIESVLARFSFKFNCKIILDYYHLQKKCTKQFFSALHKNEQREVYEQQLLKYLWYGQCDQAVAYLKKIGSQDIKNQEQLDILIAYIERNKNLIPCYALRKKLNLKNSSNRVEKANDQLVAQRQKHNGMSWSPKGSMALAQLKAIKCNKEQDLWISKSKIQFKWAA